MQNSLPAPYIEMPAAVEAALDAGNPLADIGKRQFLDPVQMSPHERKQLNDLFGYRRYTTPGHGKMVLLTGSAAAVLNYMSSLLEFRNDVVDIDRALRNLAGFLEHQIMLFYLNINKLTCPKNQNRQILISHPV